MSVLYLFRVREEGFGVASWGSFVVPGDGGWGDSIPTLRMWTVLERTHVYPFCAWLFACPPADTDNREHSVWGYGREWERADVVCRAGLLPFPLRFLSLSRHVLFCPSGLQA